MRRRYGLFVAIVSAIIIPIVFFGIIGNNDGKPSSLSLLNSGGIQNQNDTTQQIDDTFLRGAVDANSVGKQVSEKIKRHLCGSSLFAESTEFIQEYQIPFACAQPVGIAVDSQDLVWVAATWTGHLLVFDPASERFVKFIEIPNWKTKFDFGSMVWGMEFDRSGNLWFADQVNNAIWRYFVEQERFEMYKVPLPEATHRKLSLILEEEYGFQKFLAKDSGS